MPTNIGIKKPDRRAITTNLSQLLADEYVLLTKTRNAHWNVIGPDFHAMHLFFESQYNQLAETVDEVAERIRSLDYFPPASLAEFITLTTLSEVMGGGHNSQFYVNTLLEDHESVIQMMRPWIDEIEDEYGDAGTADFLTALVEQHEKMAWMLRAHLE